VFDVTKVIGEVAIALLAAGGLMTLSWLLFGRLLTPVGEIGAPVYAVVPASGSGKGLEYTVKGLLWLQRGNLAHFTIVVADFGLDESGLAAVAVLQQRESGLIFCPLNGLEQYIKETTKDGRF
jgi:hypothetical protein